MKKKILVTSILSAVFFMILGVCVGSVFISPRDIFSVLLNKVLGMKLPEGFDATNISIIWQLRLPRVFLAFLVGAALSASGAVVQSVLKNPLASPFTLGVSSGASFGVAIVIATGFYLPLIGSFTLPLAGLVFGMLTVFLAVLLATRVDKNLGSATIVLTGMVFSLFMNGIVTLLAGLFPEKYPIIIRWQMGTFSAKGWSYVLMLFPILIIGILIILFFSRELDILTFGEEQASAIGVETKKVKWILLLITAVLTGTAVAFAGVIGFIDLIAPHIVRKLFGSKHKIVVPMSALLGGTFMVLCDLISRTIVAPKELSIGVVTSILGAPFFAYIYLRKKKINP